MALPRFHNVYSMTSDIGGEDIKINGEYSTDMATEFMNIIQSFDPVNDPVDNQVPTHPDTATDLACIMVKESKKRKYNLLSDLITEDKKTNNTKEDTKEDKKEDEKEDKKEDGEEDEEEDNKTQSRKIRNRVAAFKSRERSKKRMKLLEDTLQVREAQMKALMEASEHVYRAYHSASPEELSICMFNMVTELHKVCTLALQPVSVADQ